jgi:NAD+ diphosphatase
MAGTLAREDRAGRRGDPRLLESRAPDESNVRPPNVFSGPYLDRVAHLRKEPGFLEAALRDPATLLVPVWQSRSLVHNAPAGTRAALLEIGAALQAHAAQVEYVLLGRFQGRVVVTAEFAQETALPLPPGAGFEDLRMTGGLLPQDEAGLLAYARAMVQWRSRHRYCGACGAATRSASAGHVMKCSNPDCGAEHFPRLDPAVIVLVTDGERALLGRQASWPAGRYSTIAGFVEPGESLEDAVAREVLEETGVAVREVDYHSSQPWPFPSSLMIGFMARAEPGSTIRTDDELEDARWFSRAEIAAGVPGLPPPQSVSHRLIEDWYDAGSEVTLAATPGVRRWGAAR